MRQSIETTEDVSVSTITDDSGLCYRPSRTRHVTQLLTEPSFDYLEALYEQTQYEIHNLESYTPTEQRNLPQQKSTTDGRLTNIETKSVRQTAAAQQLMK